MKTKLFFILGGMVFACSGAALIGPGPGAIAIGICMFLIGTDMEVL